MGVYRSQPDKSKITFSQSHEGIQFAVSHMCGWRLYMEDTSIQEFNFDGNDNHVFGIFDGHGGGQVSLFVKKHFIQQLRKNKNFIEKNYQRALEQTFQCMDQLLKTQKGKSEIKTIQNQLKQQDNLPQRDQKDAAGCTALVCLLSERLFFISNAGDSRAYAKKNSQFISLNFLHSPKQIAQCQRIQKAGGCVNEQGRINCCLNVSRTIGDLDFKSNKKLSSQKQIVISFPDIKKQALEGVSYILMGCDGIWQTKATNQIEKFIDDRLKDKVALSKILEQMFEWLMCKQENAEQTELGKDNMTAILIKF